MWENISVPSHNPSVGRKVSGEPSCGVSGVLHFSSAAKSDRSAILGESGVAVLW